MHSAQTRLNVSFIFFSTSFTRVCLNSVFFLYSHKKREHDSQQGEDRPYVKKPLNAFMLSLMEKRANVAAELNIRNSTTTRIFNLNLLSHVHTTNSNYFQHFMSQMHCGRLNLYSSMWICFEVFGGFFYASVHVYMLLFMFPH